MPGRGSHGTAAPLAGKGQDAGQDQGRVVLIRCASRDDLEHDEFFVSGFAAGQPHPLT